MVNKCVSPRTERTKRALAVLAHASSLSMMKIEETDEQRDTIVALRLSYHCAWKQLV